MILEKEVNLIQDIEIKENTRRLVDKYEEKIKTQPTSLSGKYHRSDPVVELHLRRTTWFANELCREFNVIGIERDSIISASILHDVGNYEFSHKGNVEKCANYYPATGWCRMFPLDQHPLEGKKIIDEKSFKKSEEIGRMVASHMSHWHKNCPQPTKLDEYIVCIADYFASKEEVSVEGINLSQAKEIAK